MGTRSLTCILDDHDQEIITLYRQYDGYPTGHGQELVDYLAGFNVVNGIPLGGRTTDTRMANGMGCLAAQLVAHFKTEVGQFYLHPSGTRDCGEEWIYTVSFRRDSGLHLRVQAGDITYFGLPGTKQSSMPVVFDGPLSHWHAESVTQTYLALAEDIPNDSLEQPRLMVQLTESLGVQKDGGQ